MNVYLRSALMGAVTGGRMVTGVAALALTAPPRATAQPDRALGNRWVKGLVSLVAVQEIVMDKLPQTSSRLRPTALVARAVTATGVGVTVARRAGSPSTAQTATCATLATVACVGTSWVGLRWRLWAAPRLGSDYLAAGIEDLATLALAYAASRPDASPTTWG